MPTRRGRFAHDDYDNVLAATQGRKPASQQTCAAEALAATDLVWVCERFL
jgi:hypothetical protein